MSLSGKPLIKVKLLHQTVVITVDLQIKMLTSTYLYLEIQSHNDRLSLYHHYLYCC